MILRNKYIVFIMLVVFFNLVFFNKNVAANDTGVVSDTTVNEVNSSNLIKTEDIEKEIQALNSELEKLRAIVSDYEQKESVINAELSMYKEKDSALKLKQDRLLFLQYAVEKYPFTVFETDNKNYKDAINTLKLGNTKVTEELLQAFLSETLISKPSADKELESVQSADVEKNNINNQDTKEELLLKNNLDLLKNKTNFVLGSIKLIEGNTSDSLLYFANSYKNTKNSELILLNLSGMIDLFDEQNKVDELCLSISRLEVSLDKTQPGSSKNTEHDKYYKQIENMKMKHKCVG